jgi:hypothetical protein
MRGSTQCGKEGRRERERKRPVELERIFDQLSSFLVPESEPSPLSEEPCPYCCCYPLQNIRETSRGK